jgi:hypothetical protein
MRKSVGASLIQQPSPRRNVQETRIPTGGTPQNAPGASTFASRHLGEGMARNATRYLPELAPRRRGLYAFGMKSPQA